MTNTGHFTMKEAGQAIVGVFGISATAWLDLLTGANQILLGLGGLLVVWFTVYNLYLRNQKLRKDLNDPKE